MVYFVYILKCNNNSFYTGLTQNIKRRLLEHQKGESVCTKNKRPVKLIYYCCFPDKSLAADFEQYLKSHSGIAFRNKHLVWPKNRFDDKSVF